VIRTGDAVPTPPPSESFTKVIWSGLSILAGGNVWSVAVQCVLVGIGIVWLTRRRFFTAAGSLILLLPLIMVPVILDFSKPYFFHPRQILNILPAFAALAALGLNVLAQPLASLWLRIGIQSVVVCAFIVASCATTG